MLIFPNGTASFDSNNGGADIDEQGMPIEGGDFVLTARCFIDTKAESRSGSHDDGKNPIGSYVVSLDYDSVEEGFAPTKVRLEHDKKGSLGDFTIQRIEYYDLTRTIQLWT